MPTVSTEESRHPLVIMPTLFRFPHCIVSFKVMAFYEAASYSRRTVALGLLFKVVDIVYVRVYGHVIFRRLVEFLGSVVPGVVGLYI
jgi:hypothetical protein